MEAVKLKMSKAVYELQENPEAGMTADRFSGAEGYYREGEKYRILRVFNAKTILIDEVRYQKSEPKVLKKRVQRDSHSILWMEKGFRISNPAHVALHGWIISLTTCNHPETINTRMGDAPIDLSASEEFYLSRSCACWICEECNLHVDASAGIGDDGYEFDENTEEFSLENCWCGWSSDGLGRGRQNMDEDTGWGDE
jgi:hypothetical protein